MDLAEVTVRLARTAGFTYLQHVVALRCAVRDGELVARPSALQFTQTRKRVLEDALVIEEVEVTYQRRWNVRGGRSYGRRMCGCAH